jgi:hypothetical protein
LISSKASPHASSNVRTCAQIIVALPEEMPIVESLELNQHLHELFPGQPTTFILNRSLPVPCPQEALEHWPSPLASGRFDYLKKKKILEQHHLDHWRKASIQYTSLPALVSEDRKTLAHELSQVLIQEGHVL